MLNLGSGRDPCCAGVSFTGWAEECGLLPFQEDRTGTRWRKDNDASGKTRIKCRLDSGSLIISHFWLREEGRTQPSVLLKVDRSRDDLAKQL